MPGTRICLEFKPFVRQSIDLGDEMVSSEVFGCPPTQVVRQLGVTKPISVAGPTEADIQRSIELEKFLVEAELYGSKEEAVKREDVLGQIDQIVKEWVKQLTRQRGYSEQMIEEANAVIFTFGSYRLGVRYALLPVYS